MGYKTLSELVVCCEKRLSEVPGTSVQVYSEDNLAYLIQEGYDICTNKLWWDHMMVWEQRSLDGVTGRVISDITTIQTFEDIRAIFREGSNRPLPILPRDINPFTLVGTVPLYYSSDISVDKRLFSVWPKNATGIVYIHGRQTRSKDFLPSDVVFFDDVALINYACWKSSSDDGTNGGQVEDFRVTFSQRLQQLVDDYNSKPIQLDPRTPNTILNQWVEVW